MAIKVINDPYRYGGGTAQPQQDNSILGQLGTGLTRGLTNFAEGKLAQLKQRQGYAEVGQRLQGLGLPREAADYLATLPPKEQVGLLQQLSQGGLMQPQQQQAPQQMQQQPGMAPQQFQPQQQQPEERPGFLKALGKASTATERAEQHRINKETQPIYQQIFKEAKAADSNDKRLNRMQELINKGNLPTAGWGTFLKGISHGIFGHGLDLSFLTHADAQEFDKLSKDFLKNAKEIFGARLTDLDLKNFLKTVPDLSQTNEGKLRVINNLRAANTAAKVREDVMKQIIEANGGKRPADLEGLVEEYAAPQLDALAEQFKEENIPAVEEPEAFQLTGKRKKKESIGESIKRIRENPSIGNLLFQ